MITEEQSDEFRSFFQERVGEMLQPSGPDPPENAPETGVVTAFAVVVEVAADDGGRWLAWATPPEQAVWLTRGMVQEVLMELS